jgi:hypothetical protein
MSVQYYEAIGRRKESTARVRLMSGSGKFIVNEKEAAAFFPRVGDLHDILRAFSAVGQDAGKYDITAREWRQGDQQTEAVRLGLLPPSCSTAIGSPPCASTVCLPAMRIKERKQARARGSYLHQTLEFQR